MVAEVADDILVMYAGRAVERGLAKEVLADPLHPYTWGLLQSLPSTSEEQDRLRAIRGAPPSLVALPTGCSFHPRCDFRRWSEATPAPRPCPSSPRRRGRAPG